MKRFQESISSMKEPRVSTEGHSLNLPPQKPPRRRYSDQLKYSACASNHKKGQNVNLPLSVRSKSERSNTGCESLPPSWVPVHQEEAKPSNILNNEKINSPPRKFISTSFPRSVPSNSDSNTFPQLQTSTADFQFHLDQNASEISSDFLQYIHGLKKTVAENDSRHVAQIPKSFHRRHLSDPLISGFSTSYDTVNARLLNQFQMFSSPLSPQYFSFQKDIVLILQEMEVLKEINDKLWQNLFLAHRKMENNKCSQSSGNNCNSSQFSEFICDIYKAQKDRSNCMEKRLKSALDQRDSMVKTLEDILQYMGRNLDLDGCELNDKELAHHFQEIESSDSPVRVVETQHLLLTYLNNSKKKLDNMTAKLNQCDEEKKQALGKVEKLQEDLIKWKTSRCLLHDDVRQWEANLLDTLCQVISQRDAALSKIPYLQEQIQNYQVHHSTCELQKASFSDVRSSDYESMRQENNDKNPDNFEVIQKDLEEAESENKFDSSADEFKFLQYKVRYLMKSLDDEMKQRKAAEENCNKLEQLVLYFGKRINGTNVGIPL